jgi:hypothetical protein
MRDEVLYEQDADIDEPAGRRSWGGAVAALVSVCVLAVLVVWSYRLGVRDAHEVPVIRAMVSELRVAPTDPGGQQVEHQERRVYDAMTRHAPEPGRSTTLAPPPEALAREDVPMGRLAAVPDDEAVLPPAVTEPELRSVDDLVALALGQQGTGETASAGRSPMPPTRPGRAAGVQTAAAMPSAPVATAGMSPGTPAIQLGAYLSEEVARTMWQTLAARNGDLLAGRRPVVSVIDGQNRRLYGLRAAPFDSRAEAQGLCAALRARNEECLVTVLN